MRSLIGDQRWECPAGTVSGESSSMLSDVDHRVDVIRCISPSLTGLRNGGNRIR